MKFFIFITLSLCVLYLQAIHGIVIKDIDVPLMVTIDQDDSNDNIQLDCDYELSDNPPYLVVKWFMNNKGIYQWIRGQQPSVFPHFKDYIDITPVSEDPNHEYRGFTLINPSIELSGTYKCSVQTESDSKSMEKELHIVDISNYNITFNDHQVQNETHLECTVTNIFPKPIIHLDLAADDSNIQIINADTKITIRENDYFDATMTAVAQTSDDEEGFVCYVSFEGLTLNITANVEKSGAGILWSQANASFVLMAFSSVALLLFKLL